MEPLVFADGCTREVVESWLDMLAGQLPRDEGGQRLPHVLVMDNAAFRKGGRVKEIFEEGALFIALLTALFAAA